MDFSQALLELKRGKAIRRACWVEENGRVPYIKYIEHPANTTQRVIAKFGKVLQSWNVTNYDILAEDWEVIDNV